MNIQTIRKSSFQIIRFSSDNVTEADAEDVKTAVGQALERGIKNLVFSVSLEPPCASQVMLFDLLMWCRETVQNINGSFLFVEKYSGGQSRYRRMCETLQIPIYLNRESAS